MHRSVMTTCRTLALTALLIAASAAAEEAPLPDTAAAAIPYVSGGVGASEREELARVKAQYNLYLLFAVKGSGAFLAGIPVEIADEQGTVLLVAVSAGPYFYARLAPGRYRVAVENAGQALERDIEVKDRGSVSESFYWPSAGPVGY